MNLEDLKVMNVTLPVLFKKGYTIAEITSIENWYNIQDFIRAGCTWKVIYESGCFVLDTLKGAIKDFIDAGCSWNEMLDSKCFTPDTLKDAGCPGYILRQSGISIKQLLEIGYEQKDIFTALEMMKEYEKSVHRYLHDTYVAPAEVLFK